MPPPEPVSGLVPGTLSARASRGRFSRYTVRVMVRGGRKACVAVLCLTLWSSATAGAHQEARQLEQEYTAVVDVYRSGQPDAAVVRLLKDSPDGFLGTASRIVKLGRTFVGGGTAFTGAFHRAASLLHARAAFSLWSGGNDKLASAHFDVARALVDLSDRLDMASPAFRPRWYLATTLALARVVPPARAAAYFADACRRVPNDVRLLTAAGWFSEHRSDLPAALGWNLRTTQTRRRQYQEEAVRHLTSALAADPRAPEATLRLAHLEAAMGRESGAIERLTALLMRIDLDRSIVYVAQLVLGGIYEGQGRASDAERAYREAVALDPVAQSARVALAQLLYAAGEVDDAADIVDPVLAGRDARDGNDPWSDYRLAYPSIGQLIFEDLVAEVQQ